MDGREKNKLLFNVYLSAVIETIVATNVVLESEAKPPLFCTPKELITDLDYFDTQIRMYYYSNQNNKKINPNTPITLVLIEKLREQYACK